MSETAIYKNAARLTCLVNAVSLCLFGVFLRKNTVSAAAVFPAVCAACSGVMKYLAERQNAKRGRTPVISAVILFLFGTALTEAVFAAVNIFFANGVYFSLIRIESVSAAATVLLLTAASFYRKAYRGLTDRKPLAFCLAFTALIDMTFPVIAFAAA